LKAAVAKANRKVKALRSRYKSAVERLRRARVIPKDVELDKIQRDGAHDRHDAQTAAAGLTVTGA